MATLEFPPLGCTVQAVLFDVDGTLYRQAPMRLAMSLALALEPLRRRSVSRGIQTLKVVHQYRRVREEMRHPPLHSDIGHRQYLLTSERTGVSVDEVRATICEWILERPLPHLLRCRREGARELLAHLRMRSIRCGAFSDYPVAEKLDALALREFMELEICATDAEVDRFKPDPRGFELACERWSLHPADVLYVGDRVDVDAIGARAAGMPCVIIGDSRRAGGPVSTSDGYHVVSSFPALGALLVDGASA